MPLNDRKDASEPSHFVCRIPVRWGDMDAMGHVNNTVYFRYMEQARVDWLEAFRATHGVIKGAFVLAEASCQFRRPITWPGTVEIRMDIGSPGRSSVPAKYRILVASDETVYAEGTSTLVLIDPETGKSMPLPKAFRTWLDETRRTSEEMERETLNVDERER